MASTFVALLLAFVCGSQLVTGEGISRNECNSTKGCFLQPPNCDPMHDCIFAITYRPTQNNSVAFELSAQIAADPTSQADYVAVGFSHDKEMGKDAVTQCTFDKTGKVKVSLSYNPGKSNTPLADGQKLDDEMISQASGSSEALNGKVLLTCRFEQKFKSNLDDGSHVYDLSTPLYVLLASGRADLGSKSVYKHTTNRADSQFPISSPTTLNLAKFSPVDSGAQPEQNNRVDHTQHGGLPEPEVFAKNVTTGPPHSEPEHNGNSLNGPQAHLQQHQNSNNTAYSVFASGTAVVFATILTQLL